MAAPPEVIAALAEKGRQIDKLLQMVMPELVEYVDIPTLELAEGLHYLQVDFSEHLAQEYPELPLEPRLEAEDFAKLFTLTGAIQEVSADMHRIHRHLHLKLTECKQTKGGCSR